MFTAEEKLPSVFGVPDPGQVFAVVGGAVLALDPTPIWSVVLFVHE
jgi:hypothetical protein